MTTYPLGRLRVPDDRDRAYPLRALIDRVPAVTERFWMLGPILNQRTTPKCVGTAWRAWLNAEPIMDRPASRPSSGSIYTQAQVDDGIPGSHDGTTVRAAAQVLQRVGRTTAYHWAQSMADVRDFVLTTGTVVVGTDWTEGMFTPDAQGFVHPTGPIAGGHAYHCVGYRTATRAFRFQQSWGAGWGQSGLFWMHEADFAGLLASGGEACAAIELPRKGAR